MEFAEGLACEAVGRVGTLNSDLMMARLSHCCYCYCAADNCTAAADVEDAAVAVAAKCDGDIELEERLELSHLRARQGSLESLAMLVQPWSAM